MTPILIFGAKVQPDGLPSPTLRHRVAAARRFGAGIADALYIPTGAQGAHGEAECTVMARLLLETGVPPECIREEPTGRNTLASVLACRRLLAGHAGPVYVATSRYHLPRCLLLLRLGGVAARPVPIGPSRARRQWYWRFRELAALPADLVLMLWHRRRG